MNVSREPVKGMGESCQSSIQPEWIHELADFRFDQPMVRKPNGYDVWMTPLLISVDTGSSSKSTTRLPVSLRSGYPQSRMSRQAFQSIQVRFRNRYGFFSSSALPRRPPSL